LPYCIAPTQFNERKEGYDVRVISGVKQFFLQFKRSTSPKKYKYKIPHPQLVTLRIWARGSRCAFYVFPKLIYDIDLWKARKNYLNQIYFVNVMNIPATTKYVEIINQNPVRVVDDSRKNIHAIPWNVIQTGLFNCKCGRMYLIRGENEFCYTEEGKEFLDTLKKLDELSKQWKHFLLQEGRITEGVNLLIKKYIDMIPLNKDIGESKESLILVSNWLERKYERGEKIDFRLMGLRKTMLFNMPLFHS